MDSKEEWFVKKNQVTITGGWMLGRDKKTDATPIRLLLWQFPALKGYNFLPKEGREGKKRLCYV